MNATPTDLSDTAGARPFTVPLRAELGLLADYSSAMPSAVPVVSRSSSNEAPDGVSPRVRDAVVQRLETANRYPQLGALELAAAIAEHVGVGAGAVVAADGSLSALNYLLLTVCRPGAGVVFGWRSYEAYPICVRTAGAVPVGVPLTAQGGFDLDAMLAAIDADTAVVLLCSPNNPTAAGLHHDAVVRFLERVPEHVLVVLDEAYVDFDTDPHRVRGIELLARHPQLALLRTFSKAYGLAGLRIGYVVAHPELVRGVRKIMPPFAVSALAAVAARAAMDDGAYRDAIVGRVIEQRAWFERTLSDAGVPFVPSQSNFVWLPLGERSGELGELCAAEGISTRVFAGEGLRVSLGEPLLPELFERALRRFVESSS